MKKFLMWVALVAFSQGGSATEILTRSQASSAIGVESYDVSYAPDGRMLVCPRFRQKGLDLRCKDEDGRSGWVYPENLPPNGRKYVGFSVAARESRDRYIFYWE